MSMARQLRTIIAGQLKQLTLLYGAYQTVLQRSLSCYEQVICDATRHVLDSSEFKNAMSFAKLKANDLIVRAIEHTEELIALENSPMDGLSIRQRISYSTFKDAIVNTLKEYGTPLPDNPDQERPPHLYRPIFTGHNGLISGFIYIFINKDIGTAFADLAVPMANALAALILASPILLITINVTIGAVFGGGIVLSVDFLLAIIAGFSLWVVALSSPTWTLPEKDIDTLGRTIIAPFIRRQINDELRRAQLEDSFHITIAPALIELSDREQVVETATMRRLRTLLNTMTYGSIGVSGARGTGKSVLLKAFCDEKFGRSDAPELGILASAPVDYDGRDFILHLFSALCQKITDLADTPHSVSVMRRHMVTLYQIGVAVGGCLIAAEAGVKLSLAQFGFAERLLLATVAMTALLAILSRFTGVRFTGIRFIIIVQDQMLEDGETKPASANLRRERRTAILITFATFILAVISAVAFVNSKVYISPHSIVKSFPKMRRFEPGVLVLAVAISIAIATSHTSRARKARPRNLADQARDYLRRIDSIRTITTGQSAAIGLGGNRIQLNRSKASQLTERDLTMPAVVDLYRDFTSDVVAWWRARHGGRGRLVIGIDELDKITNTESAERFLNEIKAVFGIPDCLYVVSTSEDALLQFEKKSLGFRSAFDSAFDDIIRVDIFSPADTRDLLLRRLAGIGDPFIVLCHTLSAGLSRDVLRTARMIIEARCSGLVGLTDICNFLISREIADLKKGMLAAHASWSISGHKKSLESTFIEALMDDRWPGTDSQELLSAATPSLRTRSPEMHTALCFFATVCDLAINENNMPWAAYFVSGVMQDAIEDLAGARSWLTSDPDVSLELVSAARGKLGLRPIR
jgi:hypothetical protein